LFAPIIHPTLQHTPKLESAVDTYSHFFTVLNGMQTRSYDENFVRPSVHTSVCQTRAL